MYAHIESVGFIELHTFQGAPSKSDVDLHFIAGLIEFCTLHVRHKALEQTASAAAGPFRSTEASAAPQEFHLGPDTFTPFASTVAPDEEGLSLNVRIDKSQMMILRDGQHIFFEGQITSQHNLGVSIESFVGRRGGMKVMTPGAINTGHNSRNFLSCSGFY